VHTPGRLDVHRYPPPVTDKPLLLTRVGDITRAGVGPSRPARAMGHLGVPVGYSVRRRPGFPTRTAWCGRDSVERLFAAQDVGPFTNRAIAATVDRTNGVSGGPAHTKGRQPTMKKLLTTMGALAALMLVSPHASAQTATASTLVHGIVGTTVDVVVDGTVVVNDLAPGATADLTTYAGQTLADVEVQDASDQSVVIGPVAELEIPESGNWSFVAMLDAGGVARLASFQNNIAPVDVGSARLTVRHSAAAEGVDVIIDGQRPVTNLTNGASQELTLPVGTISGAQLALAGGDPIANISDITLNADTNTILYVIGDADEDNIAFVQQVVALPAPATTTTAAGATTTTVAGSTTTTDPNASTTTSTSTTSTSTSSTVVATPQAVNTGSPIGGNGTTIALIALGGVVIAGGSFLARRRV
jgi:hypothetical protein